MVSMMTIIFLGVAFYVSSIFTIEKRSRDAFEAKKRLIEKAEEVYEMLTEDDTPESNHPFDEFYLNANAMEGVSLKDSSSRLNLNWLEINMLLQLQKHLLDKPEELFDDPDYPVYERNSGTLSHPDFQTFRDKTGPVKNTKVVYGMYIKPDVWDKYFTDYGYFNFNIIDEFTLRQLYDKRNGNKDPAIPIQQKMSMYINSLSNQSENNKVNFKDRAGLKQWFEGDLRYSIADYDLMFPLLNTEPAMNIHFVPERVIRALLAADGYKIGVTRAKVMAERFVTLRSDRDQREKGLTEQDFDRILGPLQYPASRLKQYFGLITWFWELTVTEEPYQLRWIIARIPPKKDLDAKDEPEFKLIEEEFRQIKAEPPEDDDDTNDGTEEEVTEDAYED